MAVAISNMGATWNTSPTSVNTAIKMNVVDTSSDSTSKFLDLQLDSVSKYTVDKYGSITASGNLFVSGSNTTLNGNLFVSGPNTTLNGNLFVSGYYTKIGNRFSGTGTSSDYFWIGIGSGTDGSNLAMGISGNSIGGNVQTIIFNTLGNTRATINAAGVSDDKGNLRDIPINNKTTAYELAASDAGKTISTNSGITVNGAVLSINQAFTIYNNSAVSITITQGAGATIYLTGTASTGNRTLAQKGISTILMVGSNTFVISGGGLT